MASGELKPGQALQTLLTALRDRDAALAHEVQIAIDMGKDIEEKEPGRRRRKPRAYRKTVRFSDEEALQIATNALRAHFVEQPLFIKSAIANFSRAGVGEAKRRRGLFEPGLESQGVGTSKRLEIEMRTETQISEQPMEVLRMKDPADDDIETQKRNLERLASILGTKAY